MRPVARGIFLTKGAGRHAEKLSSLELALRDARIAEFKIVRVSSTAWPGCKVISVHDGLQMLRPGQIVYAVMSDDATNEPHRLVAASVALAIRPDKDQCGYPSERQNFGQTDQRAGDDAKDLAATTAATALGLDFDPNTGCDDRKNIRKRCDQIVATRKITQSAIGDPTGLWTSVVAAAVFVELPDNS